MSKPISAPLLSVKQLSWQHNNQIILQDINLDINQGEFIGIIGPNGAGKTSLIHSISQQNRDYQGDVYFKQQNCHTLTKRQMAQNIAVVMQQPNTLFSLTLHQVVRMGLLPHKTLFSLDNEQDKQLISDALTQVGLYQLQHRTFSQLSGGEQQRGLIARALVQQATLLLLDEPTNHLDIYYQHQIMGLVKTLKLTALMSIHDINLAAMYCSRIVVLEQGRIVHQGTVTEVINQQTLEAVFRLPCKVVTCELTGAIQVNFAPPELINQQPRSINND